MTDGGRECSRRRVNNMRRFFNWIADKLYFPGWTIHPVLLFIVLPLLLIAGVATGIYFFWLGWS